MTHDWFAEPPVAGFRQQYQMTARLHEQQTPWQKIEIIETASFGRALLLDGTLQTSTGEEFTYHEMLVHVAMFAHPRPRRVLVIGGGDGGTLRHALLHPSVERAVEAEIDGAVVDAARRYLPEISAGAYDDPRTTLYIGDGAKFMAETDEQFDVILVDSTDPVGPAVALLGQPFMAAARRALAPGGIMAMQSGSPLTQPSEFVATVSALRGVFPIVRPYIGFVLIYPGVLWSWTTGSADMDASSFDEAAAAARLQRLPEQLRVYNTAVHRAAFALPTFVQELAAYDHAPSADELRAIGHPFPGVVA
jgi:spermidine synthase